MLVSNQVNDFDHAAQFVAATFGGGLEGTRAKAKPAIGAIESGDEGGAKRGDESSRIVEHENLFCRE
jgi:hypothetical protein